MRCNKGNGLSLLKDIQGEKFTRIIKNKPDPLRPVIHTTHPFCPSNFCLSSFPTGHSCHKMFVDFPTVDNTWGDAPVKFHGYDNNQS